MHLKASSDYGLRAVLYLADKGETCSSRDIAQDMAIPRDYLIQIAQFLRRADIIEARPGKNGGYRLARAPEDITLLDIISALEDEDAGVRAERRSKRLAQPIPERIARACELATEGFDGYLGTITLAALLARAKEEEANPCRRQAQAEE